MAQILSDPAVFNVVAARNRVAALRSVYNNAIPFKKLYAFSFPGQYDGFSSVCDEIASNVFYEVLLPGVIPGSGNGLSLPFSVWIESYNVGDIKLLYMFDCKAVSANLGIVVDHFVNILNQRGFFVLHVCNSLTKCIPYASLVYADLQDDLESRECIYDAFCNPETMRSMMQHCYYDNFRSVVPAIVSEITLDSDEETYVETYSDVEQE